MGDGRRPPGELLRFKALFDAGCYWHAHEALEGLWRATTDAALASLYRGMIQLAAAYVHFGRGNRRGGERLLRKATISLRQCPPSHGRVANDRLQGEIAACLAGLQAGGAPSPPSITLRDTQATGGTVTAFTHPTLTEIEEAAERIRPHVHRTPVHTSHYFDELSGARLFFKCENFQKVGAFKIRGATNFVRQLDEAVAARGVVTHSSGNHGQAVAAAARARGIPATVVMARSASAIKKAAVCGYGARVVDCDDGDQARTAASQAVIEETGGTLIHPFNHPWIVAGQGTLVLEMVEQVAALRGSGAAEFDALVGPVGGGGCLSGMSLAIHGLGHAGHEPPTAVYGGEPLAADDAIRSLAMGTIQPSNQPQTVADGLRTALGELTFSVLHEHVAQLFTVTEERIIEVTRLVWERMKLVIEPSAAVPLAAVLDNGDTFRDKRVGVLFTGGNVDLHQLPWLR